MLSLTKTSDRKFIEDFEAKATTFIQTFYDLEVIDEESKSILSAAYKVYR